MPFSFNQTGTLLLRHLAQFVSAIDTPEKDPRFVKVIYAGNLSLPAGRAAGQEIRIAYSYDINQTMRCSFLDVASGHKTDINLNLTDKVNSSGFDINKFIVE